MATYTPFHMHSDMSLLDSCTHYKEYVDKAIEFGMEALCFTEHGSIAQWVEKKMYCEEKGIKYLHGIETYLTEVLEPKVRDNYHTILIAKNYEGVKEINALIAISSQEDHKYYKDRITFDEFLNISDNVIKISACLASPLQKLDESHPYYNRLLKHYDYYEIQPHITKDKIQENYNRKLYNYSKEFNKPLIASNDIHYSTPYKGECRSILQKAKGIDYEDEDTFDLCFKDYDNFLRMFEIQESLPMDAIREAIENTNIMSNSVEEFKLDTTPKYLKLYDNDEKVYMQRIKDKFLEKVEKGIIQRTKAYTDQLAEEVKVLRKLNMMGFMLFMSELTSWCWDNDIPIGQCRGSVGGSLVAYITDITDVDPIKWGTVFSRFANEDRVELGDIDVDFSPDQREAVYNYIINRVGEANTAYISTVGTVAQRGAIDEIGRALHRNWIKENPDVSEDKSPYSLHVLEKLKDDFMNFPDSTKKTRPDIFYYYDGVVGTAVSKGIHPAGMVASNNPLSEDYGIYWQDGKRVLSINMEEVHEVSLIKYDILSLTNIQILRETCTLAGIPYPKSHEIDWNDQNVWDDMITASTGLFQFSGDYAFDCLKQFSPKKINDMSLVNAALRPSGATYRDSLFANKMNTNPSTVIDELLKDNRGYLVFQEDTIKFLKDICGLSGSEADNIRRAIGRKQRDRLMDAMPRILEGYCEKSDSPRELAEEEAKAFLQIIEDSSNYQFGLNHSTGYSMIGYICAYLRYYYPIEFVTAYLNTVDTMVDIKSGTELAKIKGITIENIQFGYSGARYTFNKETNTIYKGIASIKFCNAKIAEELKEVADNNKFDNFYDLIDHIVTKTSANSRHIEILIILGFFREFGKSQYLLDIYGVYVNLNGRIQIAKKSISVLGLTEALVKKYSNKETDKLYKELDVRGIVNEVIKTIPNKDLNIKKQMQCEMEYLEYVVYQNPEISEHFYFVTDFKVYKNKSTPYLMLYRIKDGSQVKTKITKGSIYEEQPFKKYSVIGNVVFRESMKKKFINGEYTTTDEVELIITNYDLLS